ncbi:MAG: RNA methyltransferase [Pseudomonadota bacterium]
MNVYISLLHFPVYDKNRRIVTTAVTNMDVHDIARAARTYDLAGYFLVTPIREQQAMVQELVTHWTEGAGGEYNPIRREAFKLLRVVPDFEAVRAEVQQRGGTVPLTVGTTAKPSSRAVSFEVMRRRIRSEDGSVILILGTGWGLEQQFFDSLDVALEPIDGGCGYNHLSVRSAAAILLDRLMGERSL